MSRSIMFNPAPRVALTTCMLAIALVFMHAAVAHAAFPGKNGPLLVVTDQGDTVEIDLQTGGRTVLDDVPDGFSPGSEQRMYSADGSKILVLSGGNSVSSLHVANRDADGKLEPIPGTLDILGHINAASFNRAGTKVAYIADGTVKVVAISGGTAQTVYKPPATGGQPMAAWGYVEWLDTDTLMFYRQADTYRVFSRINVDGTGLADVNHGLGADLSPDRSRIAFSEIVMGSPDGVHVGNIATKAHKLVLARVGVQIVGWTPDGSTILYEQGEQLRGISPDGSSDRLVTSLAGIWHVAGLRPIPVAAPKPPGFVCGKRTFGKAIVDGCLKRITGGWKSNGQVTVNGLRISASSGVTINASSLSLSTATAATVKVGDLTIAAGKPLSLSLKSPDSLPVAKFDLQGLPVTGSAGIEFTTADGGTATLTLNVAVPALGVTGVGIASATSSSNGFVLDAFTVTGDDIPLPPGRGAPAASIDEFMLSYDSATSTWKGSGVVELARKGMPELGAHVTFVNGDVTEFGGSLDDINRPIGTTGVFMQRIAFDITLKPSFVFMGSMGISAGPEFKIRGRKIGAMTIDGTFTYAANGTCNGYEGDGKSPYIKIGGVVTVVEIVTVDGSICYMFSGYVGVEGSLDFDRGPFDVSGKVNGWATQQKFNLAGELKVGAEVKKGFLSARVERQGSGIVSSKGMAACAGKVSAFGVSFKLGVRYRWRDSRPRFGCSVSRYKVKQPTAAQLQRARDVRAQAWSGPPAEFAVAANQEFVTFDGVGDLEVPRLVVTAPDGSTFTGPSSASGSDIADALSPSAGTVLYMPFAEDRAASVVVTTPMAGTWKVGPAAGSASLIEVSQATSVPDPVVKATAVRRGALVEVRWRATGLRQGAIEFSERGRNIGRVVHTTSAATGVFRFRPTVGLTSARRITATVTRDEMPVGTSRVMATFAVPLARRLAPPRVLRAVRPSARVLTLVWAPVRGASGGYVVTVVNRGTRHRLQTSSTKLPLRMPLDGRVAITVQAVDVFNRVGRPRALRATWSFAGRPLFITPAPTPVAPAPAP